MYVYALCDADGTQFYIGVTVNPHSRVYAHWKSRDNRAVRLRMRQPGAHMRILEVHEDHDFALLRESQLIAGSRVRLLNAVASKLSIRAHLLKMAADGPNGKDDQC